MLSGTDYVKTIVNGLKQWVKKQIRAARPNWNQNDPKAPDYIENRIAYVDTHITHAINPEPFDRENSWQYFSGFMLEEGKTYHITVNGQRYTCVARLFIPNSVTRLIVVGWSLSDIDRGGEDVPFIIYNYLDKVGGLCCAICSGDDRNLYVEEYTRTDTYIKQLPEECVPHAPIYLTAPIDKDLCNAILNADGSIVMVTTTSGATQVFYPCHESVTAPYTWVGTVIGGDSDETCMYSIIALPNGPPSIEYSAGKSSAPIYDLVYENDAYVFYRHGDRTTPITNYSAVSDDVGLNNGAIRYGSQAYHLTGEASSAAIYFESVNINFPKIIIYTITINRRYDSISVSNDTFDLLSLGLSDTKSGQVIRIKSVSSLDARPTEYEAVNPEDIVYTVIPAVTTDDNGKVMQVVDGAWTAGEEGPSLNFDLIVDHTVTAEDLTVSRLTWTNETIPNLGKYNLFYAAIESDTQFGFTKWVCFYINGERAAVIAGASSPKCYVVPVACNRYFGRWIGSSVYNPVNSVPFPALIGPCENIDRLASTINTAEDATSIGIGSYMADFGLVEGMHIRVYAMT